MNYKCFYAEKSPHFHIVDAPNKIGGKNGMEKQVGSDVFIKESFRKFQVK